MRAGVEPDLDVSPDSLLAGCLWVVPALSYLPLLTLSVPAFSHPYREIAGAFQALAYAEDGFGSLWYLTPQENLSGIHLHSLLSAPRESGGFGVRLRVVRGPGLGYQVSCVSPSTLPKSSMSSVTTASLETRPAAATIESTTLREGFSSLDRCIPQSTPAFLATFWSSPKTGLLAIRASLLLAFPSGSSPAPTLA